MGLSFGLIIIGLRTAVRTILGLGEDSMVSRDSHLSQPGQACRCAYDRPELWLGAKLKTPEKIADILQTLFSGVALNDIEYLVERETGFEPVASKKYGCCFSYLPRPKSTCRKFAEKRLWTRLRASVFNLV